MFNEPRNWKWMVPAALIAPCIVLWNKSQMEWGWGDWSLTIAALAVILFISAALNFWAYVAEHWVDYFRDVRSALNATPEVRMFEAAKGMHPDAVNSLLLHRRNIWRIRYVPLKDVTDWIMDEIPTVHAGFVDFVLDHSNGTVMSKRILSQGSKQFDPEEIVTDYQQYDDLVAYMQQKLMVTQALGNQSAKFLPPWNVDLIRHRFGLDGEGYGVDDEMSDALKAVMRAQGKFQGNGMKDLSGEVKAASSQPSAPSSAKPAAENEEREITDEEWQAIQTELKNHKDKVGS